jgi:mono/diheme cytochrome c family protein
MKTMKYYYQHLIVISLLALLASCSKSTSATSSLYTPTSANVTPNATLLELQQGRSLYISNCNSCHALVSPDDYTPAQWKSILSSMAPRTTMSSSEILLVTKYVSKGQQ